MFTKGSFYAKYLHEIQSDNQHYTNTKRIIQEISGIVNGNHDDYAVVKYICQLVTSRAARLSATTLAVLLNRMNKKNVTVAVDGSLFRYHPFLQLELESVLSRLLDPSINVRLRTYFEIEIKKTYKYSILKFKITLSSDGSSRGAAVVAVIASKKIVF